MCGLKISPGLSTPSFPPPRNISSRSALMAAFGSLCRYFPLLSRLKKFSRIRHFIRNWWTKEEVDILYSRKRERASAASRLRPRRMRYYGLRAEIYHRSPSSLRRFCIRKPRARIATEFLFVNRKPSFAKREQVMTCGEGGRCVARTNACKWKRLFCRAISKIYYDPLEFSPL